MTWKIRHQGSPRSIEDLTVPLVVEGLQDGLWEPTDEVMGPMDQDWVALENHPQFADIVADLEPPVSRQREDETRLDMNPLIDVCLVLLIFFILTTTYATLEKALEMASNTKKDADKTPIVPQKTVDDLMIWVEARKENGQTVIRVEKKAVDPENLVPALKAYVDAPPHKTELLVDASDDVDWGTFILIQDAASGAKITKVHRLKQPSAASPGK